MSATLIRTLIIVALIAIALAMGSATYLGSSVAPSPPPPVIHTFDTNGVVTPANGAWLDELRWRIIHGATLGNLIVAAAMLGAAISGALALYFNAGTRRDTALRFCGGLASFLGGAFTNATI